MLTELASAVRERRVSSLELMQMSLERIERLDGPINAVILLRAEAALEEARAFDAETRASSSGLPLAGLPLLVKDNEDCAGLPTTFGSLLRADAPPAERDCEAVARLRAAGAIVVGKSNLPEFAFEGFTSNRLFGDTRNPWAPEWTPGGSSGGGGAALVMGLAALATGTDGGGSVRIPAAFCGFTALKPTNGLIGRDPTPSWIDLSTKGPMATSVADLRLLLDVLRGPVAGDPTALPSWAPREGPRVRRILAAPRMSDWGPLPDRIRSSFDAVLAQLSMATGLPIEPIEPPLPTQADDDWFTLCSVEELTWIGRDVVASRADELSAPLLAALEIGIRVTLDGYIAARRRRFGFVKVIDELLGEDAVLATPTMCVEGFTADGRVPGAAEPGTGSEAYNTQAQNMTGHPAISLPAGLSANGVPFGLQLTGPRFADDLLLEVGASYESANPWPLAAPGYEPFAV